MGKQWDLDVEKDATFQDSVSVADDLAVTDQITGADVTATDDATVGDDLTVTDAIAAGGDISITTAGKGLKVKEGANAKSGVSAAMVAGEIVVSTTAVGANSRIQLTPQTLGTVTRPAAVGVTARTPGTSFTITSSDNTDTSTVAWLIVEPAA